MKAVLDLALHGEAPVQVREVAARQRIPLRFLEQIFQLLKRSGLVESKRGPRGGFLLARSADEVKLGDVLRAVEGPVVLTGTAPRPRRRSGREERAAEELDVTEAVLADLSLSIEQCFDGITFQDLCARGERAAIARRAVAGPRSTPYVI